MNPFHTKFLVLLFGGYPIESGITMLLLEVGAGESKIFFKKCWPPWLSDKENFVPYSPKTLTFLTLKSLASIPHLYRVIIKNNRTLGYFCKKMSFR